MEIDKMENWNEKKCERMSKRRFTDSYGTKNHIPGLQQFAPNPLPAIHKDYKWVHEKHNWGIRIVKITN